jgi:hypothetical protein
VSSLNDSTRGRGDTGPQVGTFLGDGTSDGRTLHFTLGVDNDTGIVLKVEENTVSAAPGLALTNNNTSHNCDKRAYLAMHAHSTLFAIIQLTLLSQFGLTLLDRADKHITTTSGRESVETTLDVADSDNIQVLGTRVIGAVHNSTNGKTEGHTVLCAGNANCKLISYVSSTYSLYNTEWMVLQVKKNE